MLSSGNSSNDELIAVLDGEPGLRRLASEGGEPLWRVSGVTTRARAVAERPRPLDVEVTGSPEAPTTVSTDPYIRQVPPDGATTIVLGALADPGWRAWRMDGAQAAPLAPAAGPGLLSWSQAFEAPPPGEVAVVAYDQGKRTLLLWLQLAVLIVLIVMALPSRRRDVDPDEGIEAPDEAPEEADDLVKGDVLVEEEQSAAAPPIATDAREEPTASGVRIIRLEGGP
jgi:hypothetical protein